MNQYPKNFLLFILLLVFGSCLKESVSVRVSGNNWESGNTHSYRVSHIAKHFSGGKIERDTAIYLVDWTVAGTNEMGYIIHWDIKDFRLGYQSLEWSFKNTNFFPPPIQYRFQTDFDGVFLDWDNSWEIEELIKENLSPDLGFPASSYANKSTELFSMFHELYGMTLTSFDPNNYEYPLALPVGEGTYDIEATVDVDVINEDRAHFTMRCSPKGNPGKALVDAVSESAEIWVTNAERNGAILDTNSEVFYDFDLQKGIPESLDFKSQTYLKIGRMVIRSDLDLKMEKI